MKPEIPATGILKTNDWGDSKWYYVACDCTDPNHGHMCEVEADDLGVTVHIYATATTQYWSKNRWKQIWDILTKGYSEYEAVTILKEQQAVNYANTLLTAVEDVKVFRENRKKK